MQRRNFLKGLAVLATAPALIELPVEAGVPEFKIVDVALNPVIDTFRRHVIKESPWWQRNAILLGPDGHRWWIISDTQTHCEVELIRSPSLKECPDLDVNTRMFFMGNAMGERSERGHPIDNG